MKKIVIYLSLLVFAATALQSCKKGDEDPALSLRSRKARLTGEWKMTNFEVNSFTDGVLDYHVKSDGSTVIENNGDVFSYTQTYTFDKDGTYQIVTIADGITDTEKGNWVFMGKNKSADIKKKEYLYLDETSYTSPNYSSTYSNFQSGGGISFKLIELSNKEIKMLYSSTIQNGSGSNKDEINYTLTKK